MQSHSPLLFFLTHFPGIFSLARGVSGVIFAAFAFILGRQAGSSVAPETPLEDWLLLKYQLLNLELFKLL